MNVLKINLQDNETENKEVKVKLFIEHTLAHFLSILILTSFDVIYQERICQYKIRYSGSF